MGLENYRKKRDFERTPEPAGAEPEHPGPLRFVIHKHNARRLHYDLRLEAGGVLKSWAVPKGPSLRPADKRLAVMVEDHPFDYLTFEGVIPKDNYGAGPVMVWDTGAYQPVGDPSKSPDEVALEQIGRGHLTFVLSGSKLRGEFALIRKDEKNWLLVKARDRFSEDRDVTQDDWSVASGRSTDEIRQSAEMPERAKPMLASVADEPFDDERWGFEIKWDGYRAIARVQGDDVRLYSRSGLLLNDQFPSLVPALAHLGVEAMLDGEIVALDSSGIPRFHLLRKHEGRAPVPPVYYAFDLLFLNGRDLRGLPLSERKAELKRIIPDSDRIRYSDHVVGEGKALFALAKDKGYEGVVAKRLDSPYLEGERGRDWLKIRAALRREAVVGGFTEPRGSRQHLGALLLGEYHGDELAYLCHSSGRLGERELKELRERLEPLIQEKSPFVDPPKPNAPVHWVEPKLVVEVQFAGWTEDGLMRQPIVQGMREDKAAWEVRPEGVVSVKSVGDSQTVRVGDRPVAVSNLGKVFWPDEGITKGDLIEHYRRMAGFILPYVKDRPESLNRHPDGITGESFYHKNVGELAPKWVETVTVHSEGEDRDLRYMLCQDEATLVWMANLGCIEINPWFSRVGSLDRPDYLALDLDPLEIGFEEVVQAALAVKAVLDELGIPGFPKTSGATGIHIYVPLAARYGYEQARRFAELIAALAHNRAPKITSLERKPEKRQGRVYLDYLQNRQGQTLAAPYCVRPVPGAQVSTPLKWEEVRPGLSPSQFTIRTIEERLSQVGDLFTGALGPGADAEEALARMAEQDSRAS